MNLSDCNSLAAYSLPSTLVSMFRRNALASLPDDGMLEMFNGLSVYERKAPLGQALAGTLMNDAERAGWDLGGSVLRAQNTSTLKTLRDQRAQALFDRTGFALECAQSLKSWLHFSSHILEDNIRLNANARAWQATPEQPDEPERIKALRHQPPVLETLEITTADGVFSEGVYRELLGNRQTFTPTRAHFGVGYLAVLPHEQKAAEFDLVNKFAELAALSQLPGIPGSRIKRSDSRSMSLHVKAA